VGVRAIVLAAGLVAGLGALALSSVPAQAQRTRFQGITQCARFGSVQFSRRDPMFRRFVIERVTVQDEKFAGMAGNQFISTVYYGRATYEAAGGPKRMRFVCLHAGTAKGAVFVYVMPE
jgi:hypothetical protein